MKAMTAEEKRQAPRMPVEWPVRARIMGQDEGLVGLRSFNVSKTGLGLEVDRPLDRDTVVKLEFTPGAGEPEVHAYAFVAWSTAKGQAGLQFFGIAEGDENRIASLVERFILGRPQLGLGTVH
jgi:hypothetical protein